VRVRAGQVKRWHFAHKHLHNCPFEHQSPELLACRAALYDLLEAQFGEATVQVEQPVEDIDLPRPMDAWVQRANESFAYWIFDRRTPPEERQRVMDACKILQTHAKQRGTLHYLFDFHLLSRDIQDPAQLVLTTTERDFMQPTLYDRSLGGSSNSAGKSLNYLDQQSGKMVTYRGLHLVHRPQIHAGVCFTSPLSEVLISPETGAFFHRQETVAASAYKEEQNQRQRELQAARHIFRQHLRQPLTGEAPSLPNRKDAQTATGLSSGSPNVSSQPIEQAEEAICLFCGQVTRDWWYLDRARRVCKCRPCLRRGLA